MECFAPTVRYPTIRHRSTHPTTSSKQRGRESLFCPRFICTSPDAIAVGAVFHSEARQKETAQQRCGQRCGHACVDQRTRIRRANMVACDIRLGTLVERQPSIARVTRNYHRTRKCFGGNQHLGLRRALATHRPILDGALARSGRKRLARPANRRPRNVRRHPAPATRWPGFTRLRRTNFPVQLPDVARRPTSMEF